MKVIGDTGGRFAVHASGLTRATRGDRGTNEVARRQLGGSRPQIPATLAGLVQAASGLWQPTGELPKAIETDLDGTLVTTTSAHQAAWMETSVDIDAKLRRPKDIDRFRGSNAEIVQSILESQGKKRLSDDEAEHRGVVKEEKFRRIVRQQGVKEVPGAKALLELLRSLDIKIAVVTNGDRQNAELLLGSADLLEFVDATVTADDVTEAKPSGEGYLRAARLLGVAPGHARAIEDSPAGVEAAKQAGLNGVDVVTRRRKKAFTEAGGEIELTFQKDLRPIYRRFAALDEKQRRRPR